MPWKAMGKDIVRADTGKVVGHSKSKAMAKRAVKARYANTKGEHFGHYGARATKKGKK
jgi:hypothetical protein